MFLRILFREAVAVFHWVTVSGVVRGKRWKRKASATREGTPKGKVQPSSPAAAWIMSRSG
jgi:hypothetical protein